MGAPTPASVMGITKYKNFLLLIQSPYNFYCSTITSKKLVALAKSNNAKSVAWVEKNTLAGAFEFFINCKEAGITPIIGMEIEFSSFKYVIYALTSDSLELLYKLSSDINSKVQLSKSYIQKLLTSPSLKSYLILETEGDIASSEHALDTCSRVICTKTILLNKIDSKKYDIVHSPRINILFEKERDVLKLLKKMGSTNINVSEISYEEAMRGKFLEVDFLNDIKVDLNKNKKQLPTLNHHETWDFFEQLCYKGLENRLNSSKVPKDYFLRLKKELKVIKDKNFYKYFLIFFHTCKFCREKGILLGPGRGSAPGSLITYVLYITELDPMKNDLIFERFLNPERQSLPDIDLDIEDVRREEVVDFLYTTYGIKHVSNIGTYSTFGLKGAFREVSKMLEINEYLIKEVSQHIPQTYLPTPLAKYLDNSNKLLELYSVNETIKRALNYADKIRDLPRHSSIHAAGMIVSEKVLDKIIPMSISTSSGLSVTQWQFSEIEAMGLPKLDLLGLRNLTIVRRILQAVYQYRGTFVSLYKMYLKDKKVYRIIGEGKVNGIFQLESAGMRTVLRKIKPTSISEIGLVSALFRPGASDHINECARNKRDPYQIERINPIIDEILQPTFGVIVYQEQVIEIIVKFAGLSYGQADIMRRAMSKKNAKEAEDFKKVFLKACDEKDYDFELSLRIWDQLEKFASYGFNKSHALAYALISYWMLYLKTYYSLEFFLTSFQAFYMDKFKFSQYLLEAKYSFNIPTLNPNISISESKFKISDGKIYAPLTLVKGIGDAASKGIQKEVKNNGPFKNYLDAVKRLKNIVSRNNIESLIKGGAFSGFDESTTTMLLNLENVLTYLALKDKATELPEPKLIYKKDKIKDLSDWELLSLGVNISRSVIDILSIIDGKKMPRRYNELVKFRGEILNTVVLIKYMSVKKTKAGKDYLLLNVADGQEEFSIMVFDDNLVGEGKKKLEKGKYFLLSIQVQKPRNEEYRNSIILKGIVKKYKV